ncbi:hypothetical protein [Shimazuella alba]|jgi:hypothetical protein|uniref:Uncharacterized protein n=1 Tax=Shimazuella alba TaxID=2690964 RepID=A0A6I4VVZ0_9BACL|nr:hypothetical protein [Shimazuella alba]MXQ54751.1 hypothetical protein [Shimazuella alba]
MMKKIALFAVFAFALVSGLTLQADDSYAKTYKSGWAKFKNYFITDTFYLPAGTYTYKNSSSPTKAQYKVCIYKGSTVTNCRTLKGGNSSVDYSFKTGGNYKIKFQAVNLGGASQIYVSKYGVGN